ncbi:serine hydrolase [Halioglobus sp. HI00S01]|uniref:serine hydrolase n=1 Tax=Halioglobus sp. HI00S01 TaxID=1822214 RepID=UPI0012E77833|nr:serine hydrolase [Halioglobus sp. HI00S01]
MAQPASSKSGICRTKVSLCCSPKRDMVTSSADMAKFVLAHIGSTAASAPLSPEFAKSMRAPLGRSLGFDIWGLGTSLYAPTGNGDFIFGHDGANDPAINTAARLNPESGDALVILVSGQSSLATTLGSDWVFWQSGYPDLFATDTVFGSMMVPALSGTAVILEVAVVLGLRTRRKA